MKNFLFKTFATIVFTAIFGVGASAETLRVGTNATYAPWEYMNTAGEFEGFDMDLARALASKAGYNNVEFIDVEFDALIANLGSDRFDIIMASIDITEDRLKNIDFIGPYADSPKRAAAKIGTFKGNIETVEQLAEALDGKTVGVQAGTTMALWLEDDFDADIEVRTYRTFDEISADLLSGRIDAGLAEASNWDDLMAQNDSLLEPFGPVLNAGISETFGNGVGIGLKKANPIKDRLEKALDELRIDGTLKSLSEKYFAVDISL